MKQLKMVRPNAPLTEVPAPAGCTWKKFDREEEVAIWVDICKNGLLGPNAGPEAFEGTIRNYHDLVPEHDVFFILCDGQYAASIAAVYHPETNAGYVHMVANKPEFRGRGIGNYMNYLAIRQIITEHPNVAYIDLTTDAFRMPAIKSYLRAGFLPVDYDTDMRDRWKVVYRELNLPELTMVDDFGEKVLWEKLPALGK